MKNIPLYVIKYEYQNIPMKFQSRKSDNLIKYIYLITYVCRLSKVLLMLIQINESIKWSIRIRINKLSLSQSSLDYAFVWRAVQLVFEENCATKTCTLFDTLYRYVWRSNKTPAFPETERIRFGTKLMLNLWTKPRRNWPFVIYFISKLYTEENEKILYQKWENHSNFFW